jgi:cytoskeleton protein RodZ
MTDELITSPTVLVSIAFPPLGEVLLSARNAKNLSLKDVSNNLRLSVSQIEALESNDFVVLPQPMITRGFIRNYARLLEVDAEPLLENYRARMPELPLGELRVQTAITQSTLNKKSQPWIKYVCSSLLILGSLTWFFYSAYKPTSVKQRTNIVTNVASKNIVAEIAPLPEIALPAAERQSEGVETMSADSVMENANVMPDAKEQIAKEAAPAPKTNTMDTAKTNNTIVGGKNVSLSVSEETWVQASDKLGAVIYEKMLAANTQDDFDGQPPFNLLIGNAKATTLTFLGKPIDLANKTKNNVAHITLE